MTQISAIPAGRAAAQRGLPVHCRRVRAVAVELGRSIGATVQEQRLLADAALVHHYPPELLSGNTVGSTLAIMQRQCRVGSQPLGPASRQRYLEELLRLLVSFHSLSLNHRGDTLPGLLIAANYLVEQLETPRTEGDPREIAIERLRRKNGEGLIPSTAFRAALNLPRPRKYDLARSVAQLPVYPALALRVLALVAGGSVSFAELSALVSKDQALAGHLISAANSCIYSPVGQISTIAHAISYIGLEETRRVITAASLRPLFVSSGTAELWKHSIEMSRWCEEAAGSIGSVSKDEAFLAGLVHDVGRLLALKHSGEASLAYVQLLEQGCDPPFAEASVFGCDHAELGAEILMVWNFPEHLVEAVRHHHHPELSKSALTCLLHLAESRDSAENPEQSTAGVQHALTVTGFTQESMASVQPEIGLLRSMSFAA